MNTHAFPTAPQLLADLVGIESWTRKGQDDIARFIEDFAKRWSLGDVQRITFPESAEFAAETPTPSNIVITAGSDTPDETLAFHGHFDTVPPDDYPQQLRKTATQLRQSDVNPHIYHGLGSYDMLAGITAILRSLKDVRIASHRQIRAILVCGEENQSEGTHAALHPDKNLFEGVDGVISTEITVGTVMGNDRYVLIGRPGRVGLRVLVEGAGMHVGNVTRKNIAQLLSHRMAKAMDAIIDVRLQEHSDDLHRLMPESMCVPSHFQPERVRALSVASRGTIEVDVHYSNPHIGPPEIEAAVRHALADVLGEGFTVERQAGRRLRFTQPWLENKQQPLVRNGIAIAKKVHAEHDGEARRIRVITGRGVADEGIISHQALLPIICIPPNGDGEHTQHERVDIRSITEYQEPFLRAMADDEGLLTR